MRKDAGNICLKAWESSQGSRTEGPWPQGEGDADNLPCFPPVCRRLFQEAEEPSGKPSRKVTANQRSLKSHGAGRQNLGFGTVRTSKT